MENPNELNNFIQGMQGCLQNMAMIIAVTDSQLHCRWANREALRRIPTLALPDGVTDLFRREDLPLVLEQVKKGVPFSRNAAGSPLATVQVSFLPHGREGRIFACLVFFSPTVSIDGGARDAAEDIVASFYKSYKMPLTIIFSTLGLMTRRLESRNDETMGDYIRLITQNCYRLLRLSNNIAQLTRYRAGIAKLPLVRGDINRFFSGLCEAAKAVCSSAGIPLDYSVPSQALFTAFNPDRLSTAFLNLISNACRFTREGNRVRVLVETFDRQVVATVRDCGRGIRPEDLPHLFTPYYLSGGSRQEGGTGIGLTLVKYIVLLHGGTIAIQSKFGAGTNVAFTIPIRAAGDLPEYVSESGSAYLADRFSSVYVDLADVCREPNL